MATVSGGTTAERFGFIQRNREEFGVSYLSGWLKVSRCGYYAWQKRVESQRAIADKTLTLRIREIYQKSRTAYGSPRVHAALKSQGISVGRKRVARLMRGQGWQGRVMRVTRRQPGLKRFLRGGENLRLNRHTEKLNEIWVADITYLKAAGRWMYLAAIMDLHSRRIVGWSLGKTRTTALTLKALHYAIRRRSPLPNGVFHTDRGIEYRGAVYQDELKKLGLRSSVNRIGCCTDNGHMESFFHSLKAELIRGRRYETEKELRVALNNYINKFYNHQRLHSGIGYLSPAAFENMSN